MDYPGLKSEIALSKYAGMTDAQISAALVANTLTIAVDVPAAAAFAALATSSTGDWGRLSSRAGMTLTGTPATDAPIIAARTATSMLATGAPIAASQSTAFATFQYLLSTLVTAGDVSVATSAAMMALASATTNRAAQLGFGLNCDMTQEILAARKWS
jgi:hypothetical protein